MTTVMIEDNNVQTVEYTRTQPFTEKKKSFKEACIECNAITVDEFCDELNKRIEKHFKNA